MDVKFDKTNKTPEQIDPLRRVFVPLEKVQMNGTWTFQTTDKQRYVREQSGSIRRTEPKIRGKAARRADKRGRREMVEQVIQTTKGPMKACELRKVEGPGFVEYYLGEELVHRSAEVTLKGVQATSTAAKLG